MEGKIENKILLGYLLDMILAYLIQTLYVVYSLMLFIHILGSWFVEWQGTGFMRFIRHYTEPYLALFRKIIPPIGGTLDISPILAFFVLGLLKKLLFLLLL